LFGVLGGDVFSTFFVWDRKKSAHNPEKSKKENQKINRDW
jgi:hypothetical protein